MEYQALLNSINRGVVAPVYLFHGAEKLLINRVVEKLKAKLVNSELESFNLDIVDGEKASLAQAIDLANIVPLMGDKRVVIVNNPPYLFPSKGQEKSNDKILMDYLNNPNPSCCLVFRAVGKIDKRKKIYKAIEEQGQVVEFAPLDKKMLEHWIIEYFQERDKKVDARAVEYLTFVGNEGLERLENELEKLCLYCEDDRAISIEAVQEIVSKSPDANIFQLIDSIGNKEGKKGIELLAISLTLGETPMSILYRFVNHFRLMLIAKDMTSQGYSEKQIKDNMGVHSYTATKALQQSKNYTITQLIQGLEKLLETELKMKTTGSEPKELLETLVIQLCYIK